MEISDYIKKDPYLKPFVKALQKRRERAILRELEFTDGKRMLKECVNNHLFYSLHKTDTHWIFREHAPNARRVFLYGDFSDWQLEEQYELKKIAGGDWEITLPLSVLKHGMLYKLWIFWDGGGDERLPAYTRRVLQDDKTKVFSAQVWDPKQPYQWKNKTLPQKSHLFIYEAHIGMSSEDPKISTYWEFKTTVLPKIKELGYNTIQLMAIQEHPYYGSFGYQVSNFFAPSFRFGTPEELKELIDAAHELEIAVIMDIVHSHSVSNIKEGLGYFDGREDLYFHSGEKGKHPVWDSRCFDYGKPITLSFLLSNIKYWMEEFRFDGFRFDGVTSMCYRDHGIGVDFLNYSQYFDKNVDEDAVTYLTLANKLIKEINPDSISIAEDVSGMPFMALSSKEGGIGFDYRMSMGIADFWKKSIQEIPDEKWNVGDIYFRLTDKRIEERTISYAESHDQAMVGDKTIIFQFIDKEMYTSMSKFTESIVVDRGIALHKLIRLLTLSLSNGGYLNFMGNEYGHPEWIDFPREGNDWSFHYARRQWHLAEAPTLKYHFLHDFDKAIIRFISENDILSTPPVLYLQNIPDQILVYKRKNAIFIFNLSPVNSYTDYELYCPPGKYKIALNSDSAQFGGFGNIDEGILYPTYYREGTSFIKLYIPARSAIVIQ